MGSQSIADTPRCNRCSLSPTWVFYVDMDHSNTWGTPNPSQVRFDCRTDQLSLGPPSWLRLYSMPNIGSVGINMNIASYIHPDLHNIW
jgi:hypothetical protein